MSQKNGQNLIPNGLRTNRIFHRIYSYSKHDVLSRYKQHCDNAGATFIRNVTHQDKQPYTLVNKQQNSRWMAPTAAMRKI